MRFNADEGRPSPEYEYNTLSSLVSRYAANPTIEHSNYIDYVTGWDHHHLQTNKPREILEMLDALNLEAGVNMSTTTRGHIVTYMFTLKPRHVLPVECIHATPDGGD